MMSLQMTMEIGTINLRQDKRGGSGHSKWFGGKGDKKTNLHYLRRFRGGAGYVTPWKTHHMALFTHSNTHTYTHTHTHDYMTLQAPSLCQATETEGITRGEQCDYGGGGALLELDSPPTHRRPDQRLQLHPHI